MGDVDTPASRDLRVATALRQARVARGQSLRDVADANAWSSAKVSRIETGQTGVSFTDLKALVDHYDLPEPERGDLLRIVRAGRERTWWDEYRPHYLPEFIRFVGLEASAARVLQYQLVHVPGLLQTQEYTRAVATNVDVDEERIIREIDLRAKRQERLHAGDAHFDFVLDESLLHRRVADHGTWRGQLLQLVALAQLPNVSIRVLTFDAGLVPGMTTSFELFELAQDEPASAVLVERPERDTLTIGNDPKIAVYADNFRRLAHAAQSPKESLELIRAQLRSR